MKFKRLAALLMASVMTAGAASVMSASAKTPNPYYIKVMKGDINGNGRIDKDDIDAVLKHINGKKALPSDRVTTADVNWDNKVDIEDVSILRSNYYYGTAYKAGNVEGNNYVTSDDVQAILDHINGNYALTAAERKRADIDSNGRINIVDAVKLQNYISK